MTEIRETASEFDEIEREIAGWIKLVRFSGRHGRKTGFFGKVDGTGRRMVGWRLPAAIGKVSETKSPL